MAKKAKKAVKVKVVKKSKKTTQKAAKKAVKKSKKVSATDSIVVGLVNLVNKHVTKNDPALNIVKLVFYACGRLILEEEGSQSLHEQIKFVIED